MVLAVESSKTFSSEVSEGVGTLSSVISTSAAVPETGYTMLYDWKIKGQLSSNRGGRKGLRFLLTVKTRFP